MSLETMTKIATWTSDGTSPAGSFTNIPQHYTDLFFHISVRTLGTSNGQGMYFQFSNDGNTSYYGRIVRGYGTSSTDSFQTASNAINTTPVPNASHTANIFSSNTMRISNYSSNEYKNVFIESAKPDAGTTNAFIQFAGYVWRNTSPVTSINFGADTTGPNFVAGSTITLYGVQSMRKAVGNSIKATGGAISFDGTYVYHTFNATDRFTPTSPLTASSLVIAGGGAGGGTTAGGGDGGGGGAGGVSYLASSYFAPNTPYAVTVGAGGSGQTSTRGNNGSDSLFNGITSVGGGGGGGNGASGNSGGSGGGGGANTAAGGSATQGNSGGATGYGNAGGSSVTYAYNISGGGGAGGAGVSGNASSAPTIAPDGGIGLNTWASWLGRNPEIGYLAGGGAGGKDSTVGGASGIGGLGGGGNGGVGTGALLPTAGSPNTGGGGGGGGGNLSQNGAAGGSGIVIIRYKG